MTLNLRLTEIYDEQGMVYTKSRQIRKLFFDESGYATIARVI
jgi:hypothetical protein